MASVMGNTLNVPTKNNMKVSKEIIDNRLLFLNLNGDIIGEINGVEILEIVNNTINSTLNSCILDLSDVRYMNSSGVGVLITIMTKVNNKNGKLVLVNPPPQVVKLLEMTKLDTIFNTVKSITEAKEIIR